jgi:2-iminoacetate synthase
MMTITEIQSILNNQDPLFLENLAQESSRITRQYFGRTITLYAPLYLSNFCSSYCTYCGFHSHNKIDRFKLTAEQMRHEMKFVADQGIENILLLTGESYKATPLAYLKEAVTIAKEYFPNISLEVHPMEEFEYSELFETGVDGITVYQETYDRERYQQVHVSGTKSNYEFRYHTPQRAARGKIRHISMGLLLGLTKNTAKDLFDLYQHVRFMEKTFPGVEYGLSFPRIQTIKEKNFAQCDIDDKNFIKILCMSRIAFPRVSINLSTREKPQLRNRALELGVTRMSAGSNTSVGGYTLVESEKQNPQFDIEDDRSVKEIIALLKSRDFDPVLTDWRRIENSL